MPSHLVTLLPLFLVRFSHLPVLPLSVLCLWAMWRRNVSRRLPSNFLCQDWRWIKKKQECFSRSAAHKKTLKSFLGLGHMHLLCYGNLMIGVTLRLYLFSYRIRWHEKASLGRYFSSAFLQDSRMRLQLIEEQMNGSSITVYRQVFAGSRSWYGRFKAPRSLKRLCSWLAPQVRGQPIGLWRPPTPKHQPPQGFQDASGVFTCYLLLMPLASVSNFFSFFSWLFSAWCQRSPALSHFCSWVMEFV